MSSVFDAHRHVCGLPGYLARGARHTRRRINHDRNKASDSASHPTFVRPVRTGGRVDLGECFGEAVGYGFGGGQYLPSGLDRHGSVAARGTHEFLDAPTGSVFDPVADRECGEHDGHMGLDRFAGAVVDRPRVQVVVGHAEAALDALGQHRSLLFVEIAVELHPGSRVKCQSRRASKSSASQITDQPPNIISIARPWYRTTSTAATYPQPLPCQLYSLLNDSHSLVDQFTGSGQGQRRERRNLIIEEL
jgi:hypothetical protein